MKIDEQSINHNAVRLISELVEGIYDGEGNEQDYGYLAMTVGEIAGVCAMAETLKEVLKI